MTLILSRYTFDDRIKDLVGRLGMQQPAVCQSMYIFKQPRIGGAVPPHLDATYLYTHPLGKVIGRSSSVSTVISSLMFISFSCSKLFLWPLLLFGVRHFSTYNGCTEQVTFHYKNNPFHQHKAFGSPWRMQRSKTAVYGSFRGVIKKSNHKETFQSDLSALNRKTLRKKVGPGEIE